MKWWDGAFHTELGLVCVKHRVLFMKSPPTYAFHLGYRCPVCAGLAMAEIKRMWDADCAISRRSDGYRRVKTGKIRDDARNRAKRCRSRRNPQAC